MTLHHIENILYLVSYNVRNNYYIFVCNYTFHGKFFLIWNVITIMLETFNFYISRIIKRNLNQLVFLDIQNKINREYQNAIFSSVLASFWSLSSKIIIIKMVFTFKNEKNVDIQLNV